MTAVFRSIVIRHLAAGFAALLLNAAPVAAQDRARDTQDLPRAADPALRDIRVQVVAVTSAVIGAPMSGRLSEFSLRDGDHFDKGRVLARFVCSEREGALAHAKAVLDAKRRIFANKQQLRSLGSSTGLEYDVAAAEVNEAAAEVAVNQAMVENCVVAAPFAGRVSGIAVHNFQFVGLGAPLLEILSDHDLELEMIVPSRWLSWLKPKAGFDVAIDETGKTYRAELGRMSGKVDPVSRSIKIYSRVVAAADDLLPGMSGRALLAPPPGER